MIEANDIPKELVEFLEANNVLEQYLDNCNIDVVETFNGVDSKWIEYICSIDTNRDIISYSFIFSTTNEGGIFWFTINQRWKEQYDAK